MIRSAPMTRTVALLLSMALGGTACTESGETTEGTDTLAERGEAADTSGAETVAAESTVPGERGLLADLHEDDHLTYLVRLGNAHEE